MRERLGAVLLALCLWAGAARANSLPAEELEVPARTYQEVQGTPQSETFDGLRISVASSLLGPVSGYVPVEVSLHNTSAASRLVRLGVEASSPVSAQIVTREVEVGPQRMVSVWLPVPASTRGGMVRVWAPDPIPHVFSFYTMERGDASLVVGTLKDFEAGTELVRHDRGRYAVRFLSPETAPRELASYAGYSLVVVAGDVTALHADVWSTLEAYAATGGTLVLLQPPRDAAGRLPLLSGAASPGTHPYAFGTVRLCERAEACGDALLATALDFVDNNNNNNGAPGAVHPELPSRRWGRAFSSFASQFEPLLPGVQAPVGRFLLLITLFVLVVGPGGLMLLRRKGPVALLIAVPSVSLVTCLSIVLWSVFVEGFALHAARYSVTWLDRDRDRTLTAGIGGYYANLEPGALQLPASSVLLGARYWDAIPLQTDWTHGTRVTGGFLPPRTYVEWGELAVLPTRARLTVAPGAQGPRVLNALGAPIVEGYVRFEDALWKLPPLADGAQGEASRVTPEVSESSLPGDMYFSGTAATRFGPQVRAGLLAPLPEGGFVARVEGPGPSMATAALEVKLHEGLHLVRGRVDAP